MRRRTALAALLPILSGCTAFRSSSSESTPTGTPSRTPGTTPTETRTSSPTEIESEPPTETQPSDAEYSLIPPDLPSMTSSEVQASLTDLDCSTLTDGPIVCPGDDSRLSVSLSSAIGSLPEATFELTVRNDADETYEWNRHAWRLSKYDGTAWRRIAPFMTLHPLTYLPAGESYSYTPTFDNTSPPSSFIDSPFMESRTQPLIMSGFGPGVYGFFNEGGTFDGEDESLAFGATFGLAGEGPPVTPTDDVERIERDETVLTVWSDVGDHKPGAFEVSFVDEAEATLLTEHVLLVEPLRNTLSYAATEGVDAIRYVMAAARIRWALRYLNGLTASDSHRYRFRDYRFEIRETDPWGR